MLKTARLNVVGVTKGKKYLVVEFKNDYYSVMLDNGVMAIRHKTLFI